MREKNRTGSPSFSQFLPLSRKETNTDPVLLSTLPPAKSGEPWLNLLTSFAVVGVIGALAQDTKRVAVLVQSLWEICGCFCALVQHWIFQFYGKSASQLFDNSVRPWINLGHRQRGVKFSQKIVLARESMTAQLKVECIQPQKGRSISCENCVWASYRQRCTQLSSGLHVDHIFLRSFQTKPQSYLKNAFHSFPVYFLSFIWCVRWHNVWSGFVLSFLLFLQHFMDGTRQQSNTSFQFVCFPDRVSGIVTLNEWKVSATEVSPLVGCRRARSYFARHFNKHTLTQRKGRVPASHHTIT